MEPWLLYAIISIFLSGIYQFLVKVATEKHYNPSQVTGYGYFFGAVFAFVYMFFEKGVIENIWMIILFALINVVFYFFSTLTRMESMRNIDSVIFFPIFKTVSPILVTLVSVFLFKESLDQKEFLGIILGICVPLLLVTVHENKRQKNLKRGIIYLIISSCLVLVSTMIIKQANILEFNIPFFVFLSMLFGSGVGWLSYMTSKKKNIKKKYIHKNIHIFGIFLGFFHASSFLFFTKALSGNLAIVFTINSFAILIPIVLSIIFYKDHFNLKKAFVISLSILSIILFI